MRIVYAFLAGGMLLFGGLIGPAAFSAPDLSSVQAESVRIRSVVRRTSSGPRGVYIGGGSSRSRSSSSRYSSGGGFSFGK